MGFLDSFGKKKESTSIPPPPPGAPGSLPKPGDAPMNTPPATPPPPGVGKEQEKITSAPLGHEHEEAPVPPKPSQASLDPKTVFNTIHNQNPPPDFKPDEIKLPKFDLPNFPKGYPELEFDIPTYGGKPRPGSAEALARDKDMHRNEEDGPSKNEGVDVAKEVQDDSQDKFSTAIPAITPVDEDGNFGEIPTSDEKTTFSPTKMDKDADAKVQAPAEDGRKHYEVERNPFMKREQFLSPEERELNDEKETFHFPRDEPGTNKNRIGNVESTLHRKIKDPGEPVFVEINDYKRALNGVDEIRRDLTDSQEMVHKLEEFNDKKHKEFERWKKGFQYIQAKLQHIDSIMFGSEEKAK